MLFDRRARCVPRFSSGIGLFLDTGGITVAGCGFWASFHVHAAVFTHKIISCVTIKSEPSYSTSHNKYCELPIQNRLMFMNILPTPALATQLSTNKANSRAPG